MKLKAYQNCGVLSEGFRNLFTVGYRADTAICAYEVTLTLPDGYSVKKIGGTDVIQFPSGMSYLARNVVFGNNVPYLGIPGTEDIKLDYVKGHLLFL